MMSLVITLRQGQSFRLTSKHFLDEPSIRVVAVRGGMDFDLRCAGHVIRITEAGWSVLIEGRAWAMASDSRRRGSKEVGVMINAPGYRVERD